jgi:S-(hydroxymethyl)glutathione dehydrogenase/alcohol dehydrogenase
MRAAVLTALNEDLQIEEITEPALGAQEVRVEIGASGVCHSDLSAQNGTLPVMPPTILGHEGTGRIVEVGSEVSGVKVGDRVLASFTPACGHCFFCLNQQTHLCETTFQVYMAGRGTRADGSPITAMTGLGTFADVMTAHEYSVTKIETDLPDEQVALLGCGVTTGVGASLNTAKIQPGSTVAVIGCGGVGQAVIQGARIAGAARIIAVDMVELKLKTAEQLGATDLVNPNDGDPVAQVQNLTGGRGVDYALEVIGIDATMQQAYQMARRGGTAVIVGAAHPTAQIPIGAFDIFFQEKTIKGSYFGSAQFRRDFPRFINLVETGRLDLGSMVTRTCSLDEVNDAFRAMQAGEVIRSVIV